MSLSFAIRVSSAGSRALADQGLALPASCGAISCTLYLPLIVKSLTPQFEVTQAVQQPNNSILLIANRTAYVRWTLTSSTAYTNVNAYLYGTSNGAPLPGSPIAAINNPLTLKSSANRAAFNDTFNFNLPPAWTLGTVVLSAQASNPTGYSVATDGATFQFANANPMQVTIVPINYICTTGVVGHSTIPADSPYTYLTDYTYRIYPVPSIPTTLHAAMTYHGPCNSLGVPTPSASDWNRSMLDGVTTVWGNDGDPNSYYYGLLHLDCGSGCTAGVGWIGGSKAAVGWDGWNASHSQASQTHAHEVGHNHGRFHAPGPPSCEQATGIDSSYPYYQGQIGDTRHQNYGFDTKFLTIFPYSSTYDIMDYCNTQWVSDYTYTALYAYDNPGHSAVSNHSVSDRALLISGSIDPSSGQAAFRPAYALNAPARWPDPGDHTLELIDANDRVMATYSFAPIHAQTERVPAGEGSESIGFHLSVPYIDGVAAIRIRQNGTMLGELRASPQAPTLSIKSATFDARTQAKRISWSGSDPAGASLHYLVRASIDRGTTWQTMGVDLTTPTIDLSPNDFAHQPVLIQVLASNGLRTTTLQVGPYSIQP